MEKIVLVVDDDAVSLKLTSSILEKKYRLAAAISSAAAFRYLEKNTPHLILLNLHMADLDGLQVLERLKATPRLSMLPVIILSAIQNPESEAVCLSAGAFDYIPTPFVPQALLYRVERALEWDEYRDRLESLVDAQAMELESRGVQLDEIQNAMIIGMANLIEERDSSTGHHVKNTQYYVQLLSDALIARGMHSSVMTKEYRNLLVKAAPLHDVGKIKISDLILQKPGKLSEDEFRIMQNHTRYGADIIEDILGGIEDDKYLKIARNVALYHHERWDGNGYPEGLRGIDIPLSARIMAIADVFDAISADRVYHRGVKSIDTVLNTMEESAGTQFDPDLIQVFLSLKHELQDHLQKEELL